MADDGSDYWKLKSDIESAMSKWQARHQPKFHKNDNYYGWAKILKYLL